MRFYSIDEDAGEVLRVTEPRTVKKVSRVSGIAIGRWLLSGIDCPDANSTDGVSLEEDAMGIEQ